VHDVVVTIRLSRLFEPHTWRAATAYLRAMWAHQKGDHPAALANFEKVLRCARLRTSEHMAFYAVLMGLSKRPARESLQIFIRVAAGEFRSDTADSRYAEALAHYWVAFLIGRADVLDRWLDAYKLRPNKGFAARELPLPDNPLLKGRLSDFGISSQR